MATPGPVSTTQEMIVVRGLTMAYGSFVIQRDMNFSVRKGSILAVMGGSGCGKSTLLRHLIGLNEPAEGQIRFNGVDFWAAEQEERDRIMRGNGVLYQSGALWSSMTLAENVEVALREYTDLGDREMREVANLKLSLVGLGGFGDFFPSEISGGMRKRAGLARAMALDPGILFFDEPSAGLDPISSRRLDDLILELRDSLGATIVIVTHELPSIFAIADDSIFLDAESRTLLDHGNPRTLRDSSEHATIRTFLTRGEA